MCKKKQFKYCPSEIDECMRKFINYLDNSLKNNIKIVACCCGHKKYPMTILVRFNDDGVYDLVSGRRILRKRNFYKKDKQGYYFIKEVCGER